MSLGWLGTRVPADDEPCDIPDDAPRGKVADRVLAAELLAEFRRLSKSMTEYSERLAHGVVNNVLDVATRAIPTDGYVARTYPLPAGSVEVRNLGTHSMTVCNSSPTSLVAPTSGTGVYVVPAGSACLVNLASHNLTIWGTAGDTVSYQAFTRGGWPTPSLGAIDGGGA